MAGSRWVKLDAEYLENPKIHGLSHAAFRLHVAMITYCARELTDGHISQLGVKTCAVRCQISVNTRISSLSKLVDAGLLEPCDDGYMLHDFLAMNPQLERSVVEARRKRWRSKKHTDDDQFPGGNPRELPRA